MTASKKVELSDELKIQFNTRISYRMRSAIDTYLTFMNRPLRERPPATEDWPTTIVDVLDDALTTFIAEHPLTLRQGPNPARLSTRKAAERKKAAAKKTTKTTPKKKN